VPKDPFTTSGYSFLKASVQFRPRHKKTWGEPDVSIRFTKLLLTSAAVAAVALGAPAYAQDADPVPPPTGDPTVTPPPPGDSTTDPATDPFSTSVLYSTRVLPV